MRTEEALRLLDEHQSRILAQIDAACALVDTNASSARGPLAKARWATSRLLRGYQLFKHVEIFDPAIARGDPVQVATARRMKANCVAAGESFAAYVARWSTCDIVARWDEYRPAMLAMTEELRRHIARERQDVQCFLAGSERTRRLAPG